MRFKKISLFAITNLIDQINDFWFSNSFTEYIELKNLESRCQKTMKNSIDNLP